MEQTMSPSLNMALAPERLEDGSAEERATFGLFTIRANNTSLTEGFDFFADALRAGPMISGYHAAEWFALNWWRIRYEPYAPRVPEWWRAHCLNAIGEGYVWPNLTFRTDGIRAVVVSEPSTNPEAKPFRYVGAQPWFGPARDLEQAIDAFIPRVLARLRDQNVGATNLETVWSELRAERADPEMAERRRLEALLGRDPDEVEDGAIDSLLADRTRLGDAGVTELAADAAGNAPMRGATLQGIAQQSGIEARRRDAVRLPASSLAASRKREQAWQQGRIAAQALRQQLGPHADRIETTALLTMLGASSSTELRGGSAPLSFVLATDRAPGRIVLRSKWATGQRFELARLLGDHLLFGKDAALLPATRAYTFRQKAQRSFAAEFLSPFEAVDEMTGGDTSPEAIEDAAQHFDVSSQTIETLLRNHGRLEREPFQDAA
jgi:hypothetical protein